MFEKSKESKEIIVGHGVKGKRRGSCWRSGGIWGLVCGEMTPSAARLPTNGRGEGCLEYVTVSRRASKRALEKKGGNPKAGGTDNSIRLFPTLNPGLPDKGSGISDQKLTMSDQESQEAQAM